MPSECQWHGLDLARNLRIGEWVLIMFTNRDFHACQASSTSSKVSTTDHDSNVKSGMQQYLWHVLLLLSCDIETNPGPNRSGLHLDNSPVLLNSKGIRTAHLNTGNGGLIYHIDEVRHVLSNYSLDVLGVLETWLTENDNVN